MEVGNIIADWGTVVLTPTQLPDNVLEGQRVSADYVEEQERLFQQKVYHLEWRNGVLNVKSKCHQTIITKLAQVARERVNGRE